MNGRQLAQIALGFLGVWALMNAVTLFGGFFESFAVQGGPVPGVAMLVVGVPTLIFLGLSYVLVFHSAQLARVLAPDTDAVVRGTPDIARLLVALLGASFALVLVPRCVNLILNVFVAAGDPDGMRGGALVRALIGTGIELACALYLVMRPERFLDFLNRPRSQAAAAEST